MKKINFEDGQLVTAGYVEIDGVQHSITEAVYEGETPLSSLNLNNMQDNIEEAINEKADTTPATQEADGLMSKEDKVKLDNYVGGVTGDTLPIGSIVEWGSDVAPANWLLCNGQAVSRTDYAELFSVLRTTYGVGDGSTTFNLPDYRGRTGVGKDSSDSDFDTLGKTLGEKTHTTTLDEMPNHEHDIVYAGNDKFVQFNSGSDQYKLTWTSDGNLVEGANLRAKATGGGQPHNNIQPSLVTNYIIKAYQTAGVVAEVIQETGTASTSNVYSAKAIDNKITKLTPVLLYSGATNATTITLNDDISNYKYVEIMYYLREPGANSKSTKGMVGTPISVSGAIAGYFDNSYYAIRLYATNCYISGNVLTKSLGYIQDIKTDGTIKFNDTLNEIFIAEVIGYKN